MSGISALREVHEAQCREAKLIPRSGIKRSVGVAVAGEYSKRESAGKFPGHGNKKSCAIDGATNKVASGAISAKRNKQSAGWGRGKESPKYERTGEFLERDNRDLAYFPLTAGMRKSPADKKSRAKDGASYYLGRGRRKPSGGIWIPARE